MSKAKELVFSNRRVTFLILISILVLSVFVYIVSINLTVRHVAERQKIEKELSYLNTKINDLEFQFIRQKNEITFEKAMQLGFIADSGSKFVSRTRAVAIAEFSSNSR